MVEHFQEELNLRKKIIEEEKQMEDLKNQINNNNQEIYDLQEKINKQYLKEKELLQKRKEFKETISELSVHNAGNEQIKSLFNIYKYYTNLIENITNEHNKYIDINEIKRKENKISLLTKQLDLRDLYINNANEEINKNNIPFNYNSPNLISKEEIEMEPINPENMKISPSYRSFNEINKKRNINYNKSKSNIENNQNINTIVTNSEQINLSRLKNLNRNDRFKDINKFRTNISNIFKGNNNSNNINKNNNNGTNNYKRNININKKENNILVNAGENAIQKNYEKKNINRVYKQNYIIEDNTDINNEQPLLQNLRLQRRDNSNNKYKYSNYNNFSFYNKKGPVQETNTSRLENEVQKKVKTILKKDFIGRYKRSPYLRLLNE